MNACKLLILAVSIAISLDIVRGNACYVCSYAAALGTEANCETPDGTTTTLSTFYACDGCMTSWTLSGGSVVSVTRSCAVACVSVSSSVSVVECCSTNLCNGDTTPDSSGDDSNQDSSGALLVLSVLAFLLSSIVAVFNM